MSEAELYSRQRKLQQVGDEGQRQLERWQLRLPRNFAGSVESCELYGLRCGMRGPAQRDASCSELSPSLSAAFRHSSSRSLGLGAAAALDNVLNALGLKQLNEVSPSEARSKTDGSNDPFTPHD